MRTACRSPRFMPEWSDALGGSPHKIGSNLGPNAAELGPKSRTMTQNKATRTNKIDFLQLPWAQEVWSSNLHAPTIPLNE